MKFITFTAIGFIGAAVIYYGSAFAVSETPKNTTIIALQILQIEHKHGVSLRFDTDGTCHGDASACKEADALRNVQ